MTEDASVTAERDHTVESLSSYLRAWVRHGIRFNVDARLRTVARVDVDASAPPLPVTAAGVDVPLTALVTGGPLAYRFSFAHPYPEQRGEKNDRFLDPAVMREELLPRLDPAVRDVLLRLAPVYATEDLSFEYFLARLEKFCAGLPRSHRFAIAPGNPEYLLPDYFACLREHGVAHAFHEAGMPPLLDQVLAPGALTANFAVYHAAPGAAARDAADRQLGIIEMIRRCVDEKRACSLFLNGAQDVPFLEALMAILNADLAKLSPLKKQAA